MMGEGERLDMVDLNYNRLSQFMSRGHSGFCPFFPRHVYGPLMSTGHQPNQWRIPTDDDLADFQACCWPNSAAHFQCETLSPSEYALELYKEIGKTRMVDIDEESYEASVYSDYLTREQEKSGSRFESPRKKARSVKDAFTDMRILDESPIRPKRPAFHDKVIMALPEPVRMVANRSPSTPSLDSKSIVTLPNLPFNFDTMCTPTRQRIPNDPYLTTTPYNRAHKTARKYLCARCIDVRLLCCWISFNTQQLQAAHLVPRCLGKLKYRPFLEHIRRAIGGKFSVNSRVNYLLRKSSFCVRFCPSTDPYLI